MDAVWNFSSTSDLMLIRIELNCVNIDYEVGRLDYYVLLLLLLKVL